MTRSTKPTDWFSTTASLNEEIKHDHTECGDRRRRLFVRRTIKGWHWYCHNCGCGGFKRSRGRDQIASMAKDRTEGALPPQDDEGTTYQAMCGGFSDDISEEGLLWLRKYNITDEEISRFGILYDPASDRLILPITDFDGIKIGWQGRRLNDTHKRTPKYLTKYLPDRGNEGSWVRGNSKTICLVEDILSAIVVGRQVDAVACLGSPATLPPSISKRCESYESVVIWLDNDKYKTSLQWGKRCRALYQGDAVTVTTKLDPKELSNERLGEVLNANL